MVIEGWVQTVMACIDCSPMHAAIKVFTVIYLHAVWNVNDFLKSLFQAGRSVIENERTKNSLWHKQASSYHDWE